jgi:hypothetical protein
MSLAQGLERRRGALRVYLGRLAEMYTGPNQASRCCLVRDYSKDGVRVSSAGFRIPSLFVLRFAGVDRGTSGTYKVVWRDGLTVGAEFIGDVCLEVAIRHFPKSALCRRGAGRRLA